MDIFQLVLLKILPLYIFVIIVTINIIILNINIFRFFDSIEIPNKYNTNMEWLIVTRLALSENSKI